MSKLDKYMNDPDIMNEPMPLREVHAIRLMIQDEIQDMTPKERAAYWKKEDLEVMEKYGLQRQAAEKAVPL